MKQEVTRSRAQWNMWRKTRIAVMKYFVQNSNSAEKPPWAMATICTCNHTSEGWWRRVQSAGENGWGWKSWDELDAMAGLFLWALCVMSNFPCQARGPFAKPADIAKTKLAG